MRIALCAALVLLVGCGSIPVSRDGRAIATTAAQVIRDEERLGERCRMIGFVEAWSGDRDAIGFPEGEYTVTMAALVERARSLGASHVVLDELRLPLLRDPRYHAAGRAFVCTEEPEPPARGLDEPAG